MSPDWRIDNDVVRNAAAVTTRRQATLSIDPWWSPKWKRELTFAAVDPSISYATLGTTPSCGFSSFEYCVMTVDTDAEDVFADGSCCSEPKTVRKNTYPAATNICVKLPHLAAMLIKERNKNIIYSYKPSRESKLISRELAISRYTKWIFFKNLKAY